MKPILFLAEPEEAVRLDVFLADYLDTVSRSFLQKLIADGRVLVDGEQKKKNYLVEGGERISVDLPEPEPLDIPAEDIPLEIVFEDEDVLVVNKPKGMVVHPAAGHHSGTLVNALLYHCGDDLSGINGVLRPGIVHRIDRDTTGLLAVCKNDAAHASLAAQLKAHSVTRVYTAIAQGHFREPEGTVDKPIARDKKDRLRMAVDPLGKPAVTHYKVLEEMKGYSLTECRLETGRTHQIRVHLSSIGHPLMGDELYGARKNALSPDGQLLHAGVLGFVHPRTGEYLEFTAPLPEAFERVLDALRS